MVDMVIRLSSIPGTQASIGWAGTHSVVVDRPEGRAGGQGLGFNGGQLLGLAIGGCLCNDLYYVAHEMDLTLTALSVHVRVTFEGEPLRATSAIVDIGVEAAEPGADLDALVRRAQEISTVSHSISRGIPVSFSMRD